MSALPLLETAVQSVLGQSDDAAAGLVAAIAGLWLIFGLFALAMLAFMIFCWWRIFEKAGYGGPYAFLMLVPGFGPLIVVLLLAFGNWPALNRSAQSQLSQPGPI